MENTGLVAIVRDKNGNPLFTDYNEIKDAFHPFLSEKDWEYINQKRKDHAYS
jgi:hypothetical protein